MVEAVEYYFLTRWRDWAEPAGVPAALSEAMKVVGGQKFDPELVRPVDYEDGRIALLMVSGGRA